MLHNSGGLRSAASHLIGMNKWYSSTVCGLDAICRSRYQTN